MDLENDYSLGTVLEDRVILNFGDTLYDDSTKKRMKYVRWLDDKNKVYHIVYNWIEYQIQWDYEDNIWKSVEWDWYKKDWVPDFRYNEKTGLKELILFDDNKLSSCDYIFEIIDDEEL